MKRQSKRQMLLFVVSILPLYELSASEMDYRIRTIQIGNHEHAPRVMYLSYNVYDLLEPKAISGSC